MESCSVENKLRKYNYQLTAWVSTREALNFATEPFDQYGDQGCAVIVESDEGFAVFTDGKKLI